MPQALSVPKDVCVNRPGRRGKTKAQTVAFVVFLPAKGIGVHLRAIRQAEHEVGLAARNRRRQAQQRLDHHDIRVPGNGLIGDG
jgi:hypothetical protein